MPTCVECQRWNPRESGQMVKFGFAQCDLKRKGHTFSAEAVACVKFSPIDPDQAKARREWLDKQKG